MPKREALINLVIPTSILIVGILAATVVPILLRTNFSNCGVAESDVQYTGKSLENDGTVTFQNLPTDECERLDLEIDSGDGPQHGKVRWV